MERFKIIPEVCFVWIRDGKILLLRRANTAWNDGKYCFPAGHIELGESPSQACAREAFEETGVKIEPKDLKFLHVQYRHSADDGQGHARVGFYFAPTTELPDPQNTEPEKCDDMQWFLLTDLPDMVVPFRAALDAVQRGETLSEYDWETKE